jgi:small subunit ribosomal protein S9
MAKNKLKKYVEAVGRRKTAVARVRLYKGKGELLVNNLPAQVYFGASAMAKAAYEQPFKLTNSLGKFDLTAILKGSGKNSQVEALAHGISRALDKENDKFHSILKKAGLLTRDPRERERRKPGQGGRARKQKQSPKR